MTLEQELGDVLRAVRLSPRQARAVARRLGWDGSPPTTLAEAAAGEGYTRERVRQLEERLIRHVAGERRTLPVTAAALAIVGEIPAGRARLAQLLVEAGLALRPFDPLGLLRAAEIAGFDVEMVERDGVILWKGDARAFDGATRIVRRLVSRNGAVSVEEVARPLGVRPHMMRRLLELRDDVVWLDDAHEWLVVQLASTCATNGIRKMLSVAPTLALDEIEHGLARQRSAVTLPRAVLRSLCATAPWLRLDNDSDAVSPVEMLDPDQTLTPLERSLVGVFLAHGRVLPVARIASLAAAIGMNPTTVAVYLGRSALFRPRARGRYALLGAA